MSLKFLLGLILILPLYCTSTQYLNQLSWLDMHNVHARIYSGSICVLYIQGAVIWMLALHIKCNCYHVRAGTCIYM